MPRKNKRNYRIIIPSSGRADRVHSKELFSNYTIAVPEEQYKKYAKIHGCKNITLVPSKFDTISKTRNWIRCNFDEDWIFMVDDDVDALIRMYIPKNSHNKFIENPKIIESIIERSVKSSDQFSSMLFGFSESTTHSHYDVWNPISTFGFISTKAFGIHKNFDFTFKESNLQSHWMSGMNAFKNRKCYIDNRFAFRKMRSTLSRVPDEDWDKLEEAFGNKLFRKVDASENGIMKKVL